METAEPGAALFRLVRYWSRRWILQASEELTGEQRRVQDILVLDAVEAAARRDPEVAVTDVAHQLGIDRSGASRFVTAAVEHGYLERRAAGADARRAVLTPTPAGRELLAGSRAWQEQAYRELTAGWDPEDATRFAGYLRRLESELP
ncbi:MarR family winged helix-turn-helix transcriptional regulator [Pseudonocardia adelaidensis]|uniref:MarR family winged helix-turn-helix transcriptional regulator n=1 Tax=Pseudonocardia adelaidensis TaxID=648754 RepID=A0ABP9P486_9PSEU